MEHVDNCDFLSVERSPGGVLDRVIVDGELFKSQDSDLCSLAKEDFFFLRVSRELV